MIATDEIKATINRLNLLATNTESAEEKIMANLLVANLGELMKQAVLIAGSPQFKQQVELEKENAEEKLQRERERAANARKKAAEKKEAEERATYERLKAKFENQ